MVAAKTSVGVSGLPNQPGDLRRDARLVLLASVAYWFRAAVFSVSSALPAASILSASSRSPHSISRIHPFLAIVALVAPGRPGHK